MGQFPIDMLRYDVCFVPPGVVKDDDGYGARGVPREVKDIVVAFPSYRTRRGTRRASPTIARWRSFVWNLRLVQEADLDQDQYLKDDWVRYDWNGWDKVESHWHTYGEFSQRAGGER